MCKLQHHLACLISPSESLYSVAPNLQLRLIPALYIATLLVSISSHHHQQGCEWHLYREISVLPAAEGGVESGGSSL